MLKTVWKCVGTWICDASPTAVYDLYPASFIITHDDMRGYDK